jgi:hypothetical protein
MDAFRKDEHEMNSSRFDDLTKALATATFRGARSSPIPSSIRGRSLDRIVPDPTGDTMQEIGARVRLRDLVGGAR